MYYFTFRAELGENIVEVDVTYVPGKSAKLNGLPEDNYPSDPPEIEIVEVHLVHEEGRAPLIIDDLKVAIWRRSKETRNYITANEYLQGKVCDEWDKLQ